MTVLAQAELRMWLAQLNAPDWRMRLVAGERVCEIAGLAGALRAVAADGCLRPPPAWPLVDIQPARCVSGGPEGHRLVCVVRTLVAGVPLTEEVTLRVPMEDGALADAVDRGRAALRARLVGGA